MHHMRHENDSCLLSQTRESSEHLDARPAAPAEAEGEATDDQFRLCDTYVLRNRTSASRHASRDSYARCRCYSLHRGEDSVRHRPRPGRGVFGVLCPGQQVWRRLDDECVSIQRDVCAGFQAYMQRKTAMEAEAVSSGPFLTGGWLSQPLTAVGGRPWRFARFQLHRTLQLQVGVDAHDAEALDPAIKLGFRLGTRQQQSTPKSTPYR